jgi:uncharacterized membrane protein
MTATMTTIPQQRTRTVWLIPAGLILLALIPVVTGSLRLTQLSGGPAVMHEASRFTDFPLPVTLHIVAGILFSIGGAFQFLPALRRGKRSWHRMAGRVLIPAGFVLALAGLWMACFSALPAGDGVALRIIRLAFGGYMIVSLALAVRAIVRRRFVAHGAWMTRAYALGIAAGTQAFFLIPGSGLVGPGLELYRAIAMAGAWLVNLGVAELVIRRRVRVRTRPSRADRQPH